MVLPGHFCKHSGLPSSGQAIHQGKLVPQNKSGCSLLLPSQTYLEFSARRATEDVGHRQPQPATQWASVGLRSSVRGCGGSSCQSLHICCSLFLTRCVDTGL